jgi:hypothetical protein
MCVIMHIELLHTEWLLVFTYHIGVLGYVIVP